jgi:hypothetical protein
MNGVDQGIDGGKAFFFSEICQMRVTSGGIGMSVT